MSLLPATIKDLAKYCGFSVSTVSKALNGYSDVSEDTRRIVQAAVRFLDYHPNSHARVLKNGRSYNLGVLFSDDSQSGLTHPFFSHVLESFKKTAENAGYDITFISHHLGRDQFTYLDHCRYREVDGVCLACIRFDDEEVLNLIRSDLPLVTIDCVFDGRVCVCSDNDTGMRSLVEYVFAKGHRHVAYIHGPKSAVTDLRIASFFRTASRIGLKVPDEYVTQCRYTDPQSAYQATKELLKLPQRPTCILVCDDYSVTGAMRAAQKAGLRVPDDLSLAGFDGIPQMQLFYPRLTTVQQDAQAIGQEAARRLIRQVEAPNAEDQLLFTVPCTLIPGETVARCPL